MDASANVTTAGGRDALVGQVADEFLARQERGERPDVEEYAARHPEHAAVIRNALRMLRLIEASGGGAAAPAGEGPDGTLGDFRIIREVGRGGMGVVYEAEQMSLRRRVALKVLPFAATMDPRQLQRFKNEAMAAACLHHPNIVAVHAVGEERGVHYYAMQYIEGRNLHEVLRGIRQEQQAAAATVPGGAVHAEPTANYAPGAGGETPPQEPAADLSGRGAEHCRMVAMLGVQAAEALDYAHGMGIVHRDIKPANLMLDGQGKVWVADFGLARMSMDTGLTVSGDVLGTLRYMSPEQAMAKHGLVDHRTDVYALGATLYEMLTGRPAVEGSDRQEILRRIAEEEETPARRVNRAIPADLETVVMKALAKEPTERYSSAREMADDLGRWLDGRLITARRPTWGQRVAKWVQGRWRLVAAAAVAATLMAVGLGISTALIWREQTKTKKAYDEAESERRLAVTRGEEAVAQRRRAEANLTNAMRMASSQLSLISAAKSTPPLRHTPEDLARWAGDLAEVLRQFGEDRPADPEHYRRETEAYTHYSYLLFGLGRLQEAEQAARHAVTLLEQKYTLFPQDPDRFIIPIHIVTMWHLLGDIQMANGRLGDAEGSLRAALRQAGTPEFKAFDTEEDSTLGGPVHLSLVRCLSAAGKTGEAAAHLERARRAAPRCGQLLVAQAWFLTTRPDLGQRDPRLAHQLINEALKPYKGIVSSNVQKAVLLGTVQCALGEWKQAAATLGPLVESKENGTRIVCDEYASRFFLAAALWETGDKKAKWHFNGADQWMRKHRPRCPELIRIRAEVARLLGVVLPKE